jgi:hypothetical protein
MSSSSAPTRMYFHAIDESEGERLLVAIWHLLEEQAVASPLVEVRSAKASIDIVLTFQSAADRALIERKLLYV